MTSINITLFLTGPQHARPVNAPLLLYSPASLTKTQSCPA